VRKLSTGILRKSLLVGHSIVLSAMLCPTGADGQKAESTPETSTVTLEYHAAQTFPAGTKTSGLIYDFKCGSEGSAFLMMWESDKNPDALPLLYRLAPSGDVVRFTYDGAVGFRDFSDLARFFISESKVSGLTTAHPIEPSDPSKRGSQKNVVVTYDYDGTLRNIAELEPEINPATVAVFPSGDLLIVSIDKWSKEPHLLILDTDGVKKGEVSIDTDDYHGANGAGAKGPAHDAYVANVMNAAQFVPYGNDLLLIFPQTRFPVLELSEHGVVRSIPLQIPEGKTIASAVQSNGRAILVRTGHSEGDSYALTPEEEVTKQKNYYADDQILEFNGSDGTLVRSIQVHHDLTPVCHYNNEFDFLTSRPEDGRVQIVKGTLSY
jgi:hypothetical protein